MFYWNLLSCFLIFLCVFLQLLNLQEPLQSQNTSVPTVDLHSRLKSLINAAPAMLFMKGSAIEPRCKFSRAIVDILNSLSADYKTYDILNNEEVRQGLKEYSKWPTYPQVCAESPDRTFTFARNKSIEEFIVLSYFIYNCVIFWTFMWQLYVNGELVGGLDIVKEMHENGELASMLPKKLSLDERWVGFKFTFSCSSQNVSLLFCVMKFLLHLITFCVLCLPTRLKALINKAPVMVFMKGYPSTPKCGFSRTLMEILKETGWVENQDLIYN